ncbi:hypothetical protein AC629_18975 [Bradyrhizobium sp. NAS80.1]|nr:hypothetical protein AC629_18975 [Bradyrhizobium sp. NAS80.1]
MLQLVRVLIRTRGPLLRPSSANYARFGVLPSLGPDPGHAVAKNSRDLCLIADAYPAKLLHGARQVAAASDGQVTIPQAAKLAFCMSEDIVRHVLEGKRKRKFKLAGEHGYMPLLLDLEEVRALVLRRAPELLDRLRRKNDQRQQAEPLA